MRLNQADLEQLIHDPRDAKFLFLLMEPTNKSLLLEFIQKSRANQNLNPDHSPDYQKLALVIAAIFYSRFPMNNSGQALALEAFSYANLLSKFNLELTIRQSYIAGDKRLPLSIFQALAYVGYYELIKLALTTRDFAPETIKYYRHISIWHYLALGGNYIQLVQSITDGYFKPAKVKNKKGTTVWHQLAKGGHYEQLIQAITEGRFDPETVRDNNGATVWHEFALRGNYDQLIQAIDENRLNPEVVKNISGATVWHYLAHAGHYEQLTRAIDHNRFDPEVVRTNQGSTVWHYLAKRGYYKHIIEAINENRLDPEIVKDNADRTVWHWLGHIDNYHQLIQDITNTSSNNGILNLDNCPIRWDYLLPDSASLAKFQKALENTPYELDILLSIQRIIPLLLHEEEQVANRIVLLTLNKQPLSAELPLFVPLPVEIAELNLRDRRVDVQIDDIEPKTSKKRRKITPPSVATTTTTTTTTDTTTFLKAGIDNKYLGGRLPRLPHAGLFYDEEGEGEPNENLIQHNIEYKLSKFIDLDSAILAKQKFSISHAGATFAFYSHLSLPEKSEATIFVFAGRKENALLPQPAANCRVILVATAAEYAEHFSSTLETVDILVIESILSNTHGDFTPVIGTLNARRFGALLFSNYLQLNHCLCLDDNIASIPLNESILPEAAEVPNINHIYQYLLQAQTTQQYQNPLILGLATISNNLKNDYHDVFCAKVHFWDLQSVFSIVSAEQLAYLAYPAQLSSSWGEDYLQQLMLVHLFKDEPCSAFNTIDPKFMGIKRSAQHKSACKKSLTPITKLLDIKFENEVNAGEFDQLLLECLKSSMANMRYIISDNLSRYQKQSINLVNSDLLGLHAESNNILPHSTTAATAVLTTFFRDAWLKNLELNMRSMYNILLPHQTHAIEKITTSRNTHGRINMATGTGKSMLQIALALNALQLNPGKPIVIITPTRHLVEQFYQDFMEELPKFNQHIPGIASPQQIIKVMSGDTSLSVDAICMNKNIVGKSIIAIFCIDSYLNLLDHPEGIFFKKAVLTLLDEYHLYPLNDLKKIHRNASIKQSCVFALTATPPKKELLTEVIFEYNLETAIADKIVCPIQLDKLTSDYSTEQVNYFIDNLIQTLQETEHPNGGKLDTHKCIVYLPWIPDIQKLSNILSNAHIPNFQIHTKNKQQSETLKAFRNHTGACVALACGQLRIGYSDIGVDTVFYLRSGQDPMDVTQIAGRVMRYDREKPNKTGLMICFADAKTEEFEHVTKQSTAPAAILHSYNSRNSNSSSSSAESKAKRKQYCLYAK